MKVVFLTGGTGYLGSRLIGRLLKNGHRVIALVRPGSENRVPQGAEIVVANPFEANSFSEKIPAGAVFVQLLGVPHPSPKKRELFQTIDFQSVIASGLAAWQAGVAHFIYVSVAMESTKIMADYQQARAAGEDFLKKTGLPCTFLRPWYVLGPGHWWPILLLPGYWLARFLPKKISQKALALQLVTLDQMLNSLLWAVESEPLKTVQLIEIQQIKKAVACF